VAVKIKLKRMGKIREPYYRIVVADARTKHDGRAIEEIGKHQPKAKPSIIVVDSVGRSTGCRFRAPEARCASCSVTGDWQRFKVCQTEGTLKFRRTAPY
jgi:small subunit ribosomal protein S16